MAKNDFRVTSIFKISLGFVWKMFEFCRKTFKFLPKRCLFIFCIFHLNEKELNQQVCLIKYAENQIFNSTSHQKKERKKGREEQKHIQLQKLQFWNSWKIVISYLLIFTNYHLFTTCGQALTKSWKAKICFKWLFPFYTILGMHKLSVWL